MSKEKLYGLRDQLGKFLYDPTPDQAAWRDKMWEEGRFDEILKTTKQVEEQFAYVEKQIEAVEAAEPSVGEKIVANTLLNLPLGKGLKGTGIGSLLGIAEEELGAAETQRLKDIEQELHQLNAIKGRDLEGGKVTSGTISGIDADMETLEDEAYELKKLLSTRLSDEPEWMPEENQFEPSPREGAKWEAENFRQKQLDERANRFLNAEEVAQEEAYYKRIEGEPEGPLIEDIKEGLYDAGRFWQAGIDEDSSLYEALDQYKNLDSKGQAQVKDMLREDMFERLGLEDARADERFFSDSGAFDSELVDQHLNKELAEEYPKIFEKMGPLTRKDVLKYINTLSLKEKLEAYLPGAEYSTGEGSHEILYDYEDLFDWDKDLMDWENIPDDYRSDPVKKEYPENALVRAFLEKHQIQEKSETDLVKEFTYRGKSQPYFEDVGMDKIRVRVPRQGTDYGSGAKYSQKTFTNPTYGEIKEWFAGLEKGHLGIEKPRSYQGGGLVMNYGDYGRSYT
jgi:hypothetical protein